jgi:hypothetical protein
MLRAKINYQNTGLAMKRDYGAANPKSIDGLNRAMIEAYGFIFHKDNKQAVKEIIARNLRLPKVEAAEDYYLEALEELEPQTLSLARWHAHRHQIRRRTKPQSRRDQGRGNC